MGPLQHTVEALEKGGAGNAALFRLSSRDIQAALDYIDQHHDAVMAGYQRLCARQKEYAYAPAAPVLHALPTPGPCDRPLLTIRHLAPERDLSRAGDARGLG